MVQKIQNMHFFGCPLRMFKNEDKEIYKEVRRIVSEFESDKTKEPYISHRITIKEHPLLLFRFPDFRGASLNQKIEQGMEVDLCIPSGSKCLVLTPKSSENMTLENTGKDVAGIDYAIPVHTEFRFELDESEGIASLTIPDVRRWDNEIKVYLAL